MNGIRRRVERANIKRLYDEIKRLNAQVDALQAENATLKTRVREQTAQTQETYDKVHNAVVAVLQDYDVVPDGIDVNGHPIEQVVGTCIHALVADAARGRWAVSIMGLSVHGNWEFPQFAYPGITPEAAVDAEIAKENQ